MTIRAKSVIFKKDGEYTIFSKVYDVIKEFPFDRSLNFSNQYYNYYLQMMEEITNSFLSEVQA